MGEKSFYRKVRDTFTTRNHYVKILLAEFLATFILILIGEASIAQKVLSNGANGEYISVNIAWGGSVAMGVWISGEISGGHMNPAVTIALCIMGRCPWKLFPIYWIGQYVGAFTGAAVVFGMYYQAINDFDGGVRITDPTNSSATAGIFATYPQEYLTAWGGFGDQIVSTSILVLCILAMTDENNAKPHKSVLPFAVGLLIIAIGMSMGHNCGYAINPARDWGPRIFTLIAGYGLEPFSYRNYNWFWVPFVGPHVGAVLGGWIYVLLVGNHLQPDDRDDDLSDVISGIGAIKATEPRPDYYVLPSTGSTRANGVELGGVTNRAFAADYSPTTRGADELRDAEARSNTRRPPHYPGYEDERSYM